MKVYLSGPMTGLPDYNRPAFAKAAQALRDLGVEVVSPHELQVYEETVWGWADYMRNDIKALADCTSIVLMPGWEKSQGSHIELNLAHRLGMGVMLLEDVLPKVKGPRVEELLETAERERDALAARVQEMREALLWCHHVSGYVKSSGVVERLASTPDTSIQTLARRDAVIWMEAANWIAHTDLSALSKEKQAECTCLLTGYIVGFRAKADELLKGLEKEHEPR